MKPAVVAGRMLVWLLAAALLGAMVRLAWLGDDAFITLRTVENVLAGHGPVWNVGERVQTYTHPLWMWLLVAMRGLSGEAQTTTIVVSLLLSATAALWLAWQAGRGAAVVLVLLLASRAFGDYATSGLETPLAMVLLVLLARLDERSPHPRTALHVALVTALLATTRLDLILIGAPVLLAHLRSVRPARWPLLLAAGLAPLGAWSAFAWFYYGSPFPITAYAKALNGVPSADLWLQGLRYAMHTVRHDPATMATIAAGVAVGAFVRPLQGRGLAVGAALYGVYVVRVGGDFMAGRFFVPPLVIAVALLARGLRGASAPAAGGLGALAMGLALVPGLPPYLRSVDDDLVPPGVAGNNRVAPYGIVDERRFYFARGGLLSPRRDLAVAGEGSRRLRAEGRRTPLVVKYEVAGRDPFVAGDLFHVVDCWLVDPLLMRLPVLQPDVWRIGHFVRGIPAGYLESLAHGGDRIAHPGLRACYDDLRLVVRAPLSAGERLAALWRLSTGAHASGLRAYVADEYRTPRRREIDGEPLRTSPVPAGTFWFDEPRVALLNDAGLGLRFGTPMQARSLRVSLAPLAPLARYRLTFLSGGQPVGAVEVEAIATVGPPPEGPGLLDYLRGFLGMRDYEVAVPESARAFDRLEIDCVGEPVLVPAFGGFAPLP